ncbi:hypothetical protein BCL57_001474 [Agromyces flavus]|uniref:Lipoprotein n=2 Tax=Agromyces flavus TaxID=589382 RepID=A0ABT1KLE4_9MICO|nr:hypothetical protein [Agromyces flavus]MCP2367320.1 hypothetical protein [Agromyces flavus]GGI45963.1 hypothetical protein GCM10010932_12210 [Agromyces flavus]
MDSSPRAIRHARRPRLAPAAATALTAAGVAAALAACSPSDTQNEPTSEPPATTPVETTPPPESEMPPASDTPTGTADRALDALDAYALCRAQTYAFYPGDFALLEYAPFTDATVLQRDDGDWFVYIEVDDGNRPADLVESGGSECIVGGTVGEPEWQSFGTISRDVAEDSIANYNRPPAQP